MNKNIVCISVLALIVLVGFAGCGDTTASKLEDAKIAMDNRDFSKAILLTEELLDKNGDGPFNKADQASLTVGDAEAAHLLASARFGQAGIDLIAMLALAEKNGGTAKPSAPKQTANSCITDADFRTISNLIPAILTKTNLDNLELGLVVYRRYHFKQLGEQCG